MPVNAFAVVTTVGVVVGGPALFFGLIGKNPLPPSRDDAPVVVNALPLYIPTEAVAIEAQPAEVVNGRNVLKRFPFDDFELRVPVSDNEPAPAARRSEAKQQTAVARRSAPVSPSTYSTMDPRSPWNAFKSGANNAYRRDRSTSTLGATPYGAYGTYSNGQRFNPFTARFARANQRTFHRKWYE